MTSNYPEFTHENENLSERLKGKETITFVNSSHRNEQHRNENLMRDDVNTSNTVEYYEEVHPNYSNKDVSFHPNDRELKYNPAPVYVSEIEKNLPSDQVDRLNDTIYELWRLQEIIGNCDRYLSYYYNLRENSLNQYHIQLDSYYTNNSFQSSYDQSLNPSNTASVEPEIYQNHNLEESSISSKSWKNRSEKSCEYWEGVLPKRKRTPGDVNQMPVYSRKVFVGGVPWDITEEQLRIAFGKFGTFTIQWPTRDSVSSNVRIKGYLYLIFENEESVKSLIDQIKDSGTESNGGSITFNFRIKCNRNKHVQIVPWITSDNYWEEKCFNIDDSTFPTIFVGGLHGKLYAQALFAIFNSLFKNVISVKIDTDEYNYPTGSGSIRFNCRSSYIKAINANYIEVKTSTFGPKSIEIQHYMEDEVCHLCKNAPGKKFCKTDCFEYYCELCWKRKHKNMIQHVAVTRHHKNKDQNVDSLH